MQKEKYLSTSTTTKMDSKKSCSIVVGQVGVDVVAMVVINVPLPPYLSKMEPEKVVYNLPLCLYASWIDLTNEDMSCLHGRSTGL